jgi:glucose-1-phosphate adenylyltransferase
MLDEHKKNGADCTIAVLKVPMEEASRFGILNTNPDGSIYEFEEKPKNPKSNNASMGIYIFNTKTLIEYLKADEADENSSNDFGKNIIPNMLNDGKKMYSYLFEGYWKDVGTIESLWEANMDLLGKTPEFNLFDKHWRIFYRHNAEPPHKFGAKGKAYNTMLTEGCVVNGEVRNSVLSNGVCIEEGAYVNDCVIMANVTIKKGAKVEYAIIDYDTVIGENATVGGCRAEGNKITVLGAGCKVADGDTVPAGAMLDAQI